MIALSGPLGGHSLRRPAREAAAELTRRWKFSDLLQFQAEVARHALRAKGPGGVTALELARDLLRIARSGLKGWHKLSGLDESRNLDPVDDILDTGRTWPRRCSRCIRPPAGTPLQW